MFVLLLADEKNANSAAAARSEVSTYLPDGDSDTTIPSVHKTLEIPVLTARPTHLHGENLSSGHILGGIDLSRHTLAN
eukprot:scaffold456849_cov18-Prasinocladus_malaysianus.AAC.1